MLFGIVDGRDDLHEFGEFGDGGVDGVAPGLERIDSQGLSMSDIDRMAQTLAEAKSSALKSIKLTASERGMLDGLAEQLRLSRSQFVAAVVSLVLDDVAPIDG